MSSSPAVIFDVDGVLVDSFQAHYESWQRMGQEYGVVMTYDQFLTTFGRTSREIIRELWGDRITTEEEVAAYDDRKEALFREILAADFPAMDGAVELIRSLYEDGIPMAVGSSGPPDNVHLTLDSLGCRHLFGAIITGKDVTRGKPDPQVFQVGAQRLGIAPSQCVVFEDAPAGVRAAKSAGMKCIAVVSTGRVREELQRADLLIGSLREVDPRRIRELFGDR